MTCNVLLKAVPIYIDVAQAHDANRKTIPSVKNVEKTFSQYTKKMPQTRFIGACGKK
jgi:hypothetical protein